MAAKAKKTAQKKRPAKKPAPTARVDILLDGSGSMADRWTETIDAINQYVAGLAKEGVKANVNLAKFADPATSFRGDNWYKLLRDSVPVNSWDKLTKGEHLSPLGYTPLYDAIGKMAQAALDADTPKLIMVVLTDGEENASKETSREAANKLLDQCRAKGWQVLFLGVDFNNFAQARNLGTQYGQTITMFKQSMAPVMRDMSRNTQAYASGMAATMDWADATRAAATAKPSA